jgi:exosome complex component RRP41
MQNYEILALAGLRIDGRRSNELRKLQHRFGLVPNADGSAYIEQGLNKVLVVVLGPHEPKKRSTDGGADRVCLNYRLQES